MGAGSFINFVSAFESGVRLQGHVFKAETIYGTVLAANFTARELIHADTVGPDRPLAIVYIPAVSPFAFILADNPDLLPFAPRFRALNGPIIVTRRRLMPEGTWAFCDPLHSTYLIAHEEVDADGSRMAAFYGRDVGDWQHFRLTEIAPQTLPLSVVQQVTLIDRVLSTPPTSIIDFLRDASGADRSIAESLLIRTLLPSEVEILCDHLLEDQSRLVVLSAIFPVDPWAQSGLPDLWRFLRMRRARASILRSPSGKRTQSTIAPPTTTAIGADLDRLASDGSTGDYVSLPHRCTVMARRGVPPLKDICVIVPSRNDGLYLVDWLAYHNMIGVDRVFLYTNDNIDGSDRLLRALAAAGEISLIENSLAPNSVSPVYKAYGHALSIVPEILDYRWCAIIDSDEIIGIDKLQFSSIKDYLAWQELRPVDSIALNWLVYGWSGELRWKHEPLISRFQERYADPTVKTIFRPRLFHHAMPHFPHTEGRTEIICRDATGELHPTDTPHSPIVRDGPAWIAHYFYRSLEEFIWKFARGRGDMSLKQSLPPVNVPELFAKRFVELHNEHQLALDDRMAAFATAARDEGRRLRALQGVMSAEEDVRAFYQTQSASLEPMLRDLRKTASPTQAAFYDLLLLAT